MIKFKQIDFDATSFLECLPELFKKFPEVLLSYIFGSYATGNIKPLSDIDIAYLINPALTLSSSLEFELNVESEIAHTLKTDEVDCVCLNNAPVELQYQIISYGKNIYSKGESERVLYETIVLDKYFDFKYYLDQNKNIFLQNIRESL